MTVVAFPRGQRRRQSVAERLSAIARTTAIEHLHVIEPRGDLPRRRQADGGHRRRARS
jgi:hypothetical protein